MSQETIKLRLVSDGTPEKSYLMDEDGRIISNVLSIKWELEAGPKNEPQAIPVLTVKLANVPVKLSYTPPDLP